MPATSKWGLAWKAEAWCMPRLPAPTTRTLYFLGMRHLRFVPLQDLGGHVVHFLFGQLGEHGQRDARGRVAHGIRHRERNARTLAPRVAFLLVDGDGVVALGVDALVVEEIQELIA